jgi:hypothetical protein
MEHVTSQVAASLLLCDGLPCNTTPAQPVGVLPFTGHHYTSARNSPCPSSTPLQLYSTLPAGFGAFDSTLLDKIDFISAVCQQRGWR